MCVSIINCNPNSNILEMKKIIDDITSTTFQGLMAILAGLFIIGSFLGAIAFVVLTIVAITGPHGMLWLRIVGVLALCFVVGKIVGK
jgi:hypothetical protein